MPKISIIIPVYNVASYLTKCLDSVLAQSFQDIEIIIIDDGSNDGGEAICDEYATRDNRIVVFHTANQGLSAARNLGIEHASGEWLMFVDSDDWVEPGFCETPLRVATLNNADIVIFMAVWEKNGKQHILSFKGPSIPDGSIDSHIAVNNSGAFAWNKLYKRELFTAIRYPEGKVYEDIATTHELILKAKKVQIISDVLYHYVLRRGSIGCSHSLKYRKDGFEAALQRFKELREAECEDDLSTLLYFTIGYLAVANPSAESTYSKAVEIADSVERIPNGLNMKRHIMLMIWKLSPKLFHLICRLLGQKDKSNLC